MNTTKYIELYYFIYAYFIIIVYIDNMYIAFI